MVWSACMDSAVIESFKAELQKYQTNFQKLRKQNSELALANTQMMRVLILVLLIVYFNLFAVVDC
jgi:hypothetical protein